MNADPIAAVRDLFTMIPVAVRRVVYGLLGLLIVVDGLFALLPDSVGDALTVVFGILASVMALANSGTPADPDA